MPAKFARPGELRRVADEDLDHVPVLLGQDAEVVAGGHVAEGAAPVTGDGEELRLLPGARRLRARNCVSADGALQGAAGLLEIRALLLLDGGLLRADAHGLDGAINVPCDVLLELRGVRLERLRLALQAQDLLAQLRTGARGQGLRFGARLLDPLLRTLAWSAPSHPHSRRGCTPAKE